MCYCTAWITTSTAHDRKTTTMEKQKQIYKFSNRVKQPLNERLYYGMTSRDRQQLNKNRYFNCSCRGINNPTIHQPERIDTADIYDRLEERLTTNSILDKKTIDELIKDFNLRGGFKC